MVHRFASFCFTSGVGSLARQPSCHGPSLKLVRLQPAAISISQTCLPGFSKGTVPGAPPSPLPRPPKNGQKKNKRNVLGTTWRHTHILVKNMWSDSRVVQRYRTRAPPSPYTKPLECPRVLLKNVPGPRPEGTFAPRHAWETLKLTHLVFVFVVCRLVCWWRGHTG